jgi:hypothetical protein
MAAAARCTQMTACDPKRTFEERYKAEPFRIHTIPGDNAFGNPPSQSSSCRLHAKTARVPCRLIPIDSIEIRKIVRIVPNRSPPARHSFLNLARR